MKCEKCSFTSSRSTWSKLWILGMGREPKERIFRFTPLQRSQLIVHILNLQRTRHYALRKIRLSQKDNAGILKNFHEIRIVCGWFERSAYIPESSIISCNVELVFQCHWYAMEWPYGLPSTGKVLIQGLSALNGSLKQNFCPVRRSFLVSQQCGVPVRQFVLIR